MAIEFPTGILLWLNYLNGKSLFVVDHQFIGEQYLFFFVFIGCIALKATVSFMIALFNCGISVCREY